MSITDIILNLTCQSMGCENMDNCPYSKDKTECPKQIECNVLCKLFCSDEDEE